MICVAATRLYANMVGPIITKRNTPNNTACRTEQQNVQAQTDNTACHHTPRPPPILHDTTLEQYNLRQTLQLGTPARNDQGRGRVSVQFVEARDAFACLEQPLLHTGVLHIQRGVAWTMRRYTIKKSGIRIARCHRATRTRNTQCTRARKVNNYGKEENRSIVATEGSLW